MNGKNKAIDIKNLPEPQILEWLQRLRNESGKPWSTERLVKPWHTENPSIQGTWTPFTNRYPLDLINSEEIQNNIENSDVS